jgi:hypothetical protein
MPKKVYENLTEFEVRNLTNYDCETKMQLLTIRGVIQNKLQTAHNSKTIENSKKSVKQKFFVS